MDNDIKHFQYVVEDFYMSHFAEIKKKVDKEAEKRNKQLKSKDIDLEYEYEEDYLVSINVNTQNESCFFPNNHSRALRPHELLFWCKMVDGKPKTYFMEDGKDKVAEMLGLVDLYENNKRIEIDYVRKEDGALHLDLPERLQGYSKGFYKLKLYGLDKFVDECNYTGWGDCMTNNVLEVIAGIMKQEFIDYEKKEIIDCLNWYVGPGDCDDMNYYAEFDFSHCEIAMSDDNDPGWAIFFCYKYSGLEEYDE